MKFDTEIDEKHTQTFMQSITIPCVCVRKFFLLYVEFVGLSSYGQYQVLKKNRVSEHL